MVPATPEAWHVPKKCQHAFWYLSYVFIHVNGPFSPAVVFLQLFYTQSHCYLCAPCSQPGASSPSPQLLSLQPGHQGLGMTKGSFCISVARYLRTELSCLLIAVVINLWGGLLYFMAWPEACAIVACVHSENAGAL